MIFALNQTTSLRVETVNVSLSKLNRETDLLCNAIDCFVKLLRKHEYYAKGFSPAAIDHFNSLDKNQRESILRQFLNYAELCAEADSYGISLRDSKELTKRILKKMGMLAANNFFDTLETDDIVEIYNLEGVQIFRNFSFYEHCSYTILELISYPWYELLERHESITKSIAEHIKIILGDCNNSIVSQVKPHCVRELFSEEKLMFTSQFHYFSPLFAGAGLKSGFICSGKLSHIPHHAPSVSFI